MVTMNSFHVLTFCLMIVNLKLCLRVVLICSTVQKMLIFDAEKPLFVEAQLIFGIVKLPFFVGLKIFHIENHFCQMLLCFLHYLKKSRDLLIVKYSPEPLPYQID